MWTCPDCGRQFHNANNAHSCMARIGVEEHLAGKPAGVAEAYRRFEALVREIGPITVEPLKSRIAFKARTTFASATFTKGSLRAGLVLARRLDDPRLKVDTYGGRHVHTLDVTEPAQLPEDLRGWLTEAYELGDRGAGRRGSPS
jgi:Domain of unknown function (DUF5655)